MRKPAMSVQRFRQAFQKILIRQMLDLIETWISGCGPGDQK